MGTLVSETVLDRLVDADGQTSMLDLKHAVQNLGLHCRVVATNVETLKQLNDCVAILYLSGRQHFVVLDRIDKRYVWLIDLTSTRMYYRIDTALFPADWPQGIALLVSDRSIDGAFGDLSDTTAKSILGAASGWSCTYLLQEYDLVTCEEVSNSCIGYQWENYEILDCEPTISGLCGDSDYIMRQQIWQCENEPSTPQCDRSTWSYQFYTWSCIPDYW
jgi:hypothetical protein